MAPDLPARPQVTPDPKPEKRIRAEWWEWERLRRWKLKPCRCCGVTLNVELHHLVGRDLGGDDVAANLVPLCRTCHKLVEERDSVLCTVLREFLRAEEIIYVVRKKGEDFLNRYYPAFPNKEMDLSDARSHSPQPSSSLSSSPSRLEQPSSSPTPTETSRSIARPSTTSTTGRTAPSQTDAERRSR